LNGHKGLGKVELVCEVDTSLIAFTAKLGKQEKEEYGEEEHNQKRKEKKWGFLSLYRFIVTKLY
jgi:hypothetical protein